MENKFAEGSGNMVHSSLTKREAMKLIRPHGGTLVNREVTGVERERLIQSAANMPVLRLGPRELADLEMIATGAYSPLEGFLDRSDYAAVCSTMRLANGIAWSIPVTLPLADEQANGIRQFEDVALYQDSHLLGILHLLCDISSCVNLCELGYAHREKLSWVTHRKIGIYCRSFRPLELPREKRYPCGSELELPFPQHPTEAGRVRKVW